MSSSRTSITVFPFRKFFEMYECIVRFRFVIRMESLAPGGGGGTWPTSIRGRAAGKSKKLPCPGVKFPKMMLCLGVKFS